MPPATLPTPADVAARALYLLVNRGAAKVAGHAPAPIDVEGRAQYVYVNRAVYGNPSGGETMGTDDVLSRALYVYVTRALALTQEDVALRSLYLYAAYTNADVFPWLMRINPNEQFPGGEVSVYGDGFGPNAAAEGSAVRLGVYDPAVPGPGQLMGVVSWLERSPGLWPANGGDPILPAIVVTVPSDAESGMLSIEETT